MSLVHGGLKMVVSLCLWLALYSLVALVYWQLSKNCSNNTVKSVQCYLTWPSCSKGREHYLYRVSWIKCFFFPANYVLILANHAELRELCNYLFSAQFYCFNLLSLQTFFGLTFNTKLSIFNGKSQERKLFCRQINQIRALFRFPSCEIGHNYFFQSWRVLYQKTGPNAYGQKHTMPGMPRWFAIFLNALYNKVVAISCIIIPEALPLVN